MPEEGVIGVLPVLRAREGVGFDLAGAYAAWEEAGMPEPTAEEVAEWERLSQAPEMVSADGSMPSADLPDRSPALVWATGRDVIRPPAKALEVALTDKGRDSQVFRPFSSGLALPRLIVELQDRGCPRGKA
ncbi:MAG: hypothetical protein ACXWES_03285 [Solirubrobacterales bacterium]